MKTFHWTPLPESKITSTFWSNDASDVHSILSRENVDKDLECLFSLSPQGFFFFSNIEVTHSFQIKKRK